MNILYHFRVRGTGVERVHIAGIADGFRKLGHYVAFVSPSGADPTIESGSSAGQQAKPRFLHACADFLPQIAFEFMEILYPFVIRKKLKNALRRKKFDFIYERYAFFNTAGVDAAKKAGIPLVLEVNELSGFKRVRGQFFVKQAAKAEKYILENTTLIVTVSNFLKDRIAEIIGTESGIIVVPNGVSAEWLEKPDKNETACLRQKLGIKPGVTIGFCGGLTHWHNFDFLIKIFAETRNSFPDANLLLVGDGPMRREIIKTAERAGVADGTRITGHVSHLNARKHMDIFDVALIPHSNEYRSPIKLFEYMGAGKPVVAVNTEPIRQIIENGIDGLLFPAENVKEASAAIAKLLDNPVLMQTIGEKALEKIKSGYLWKQHAEKILKYEKFIN